VGFCKTIFTDSQNLASSSKQQQQQPSNTTLNSMALLSSTVVFKSRASELGLSAEAIAKAIEEGLGSMGQFGFATKFLPGACLWKVLSKKLVGGL
jgi:hypothetical protein